MYALRKSRSKCIYLGYILPAPIQRVGSGREPHKLNVLHICVFQEMATSEVLKAIEQAEKESLMDAQVSHWLSRHFSVAK